MPWLRNTRTAPPPSNNVDNTAICFGPANGAVHDGTIIEATKEAKSKGCAQLLIFAAAISPYARKTANELANEHEIRVLVVQINNDITMTDLLKGTPSSEIFAVIGLPDIALRKLKKKSKDGTLYEVRLLGLDTFEPGKKEISKLVGNDVPCWMLDTDYDGQCFRARQVFFPRTGAWRSLSKAIKGEFAETVWERLASDTSEPFVLGESKKIAVIVIDDRGNELMVVKSDKDAA